MTTRVFYDIFGLSQEHGHTMARQLMSSPTLHIDTFNKVEQDFQISEQYQQYV